MTLIEGINAASSRANGADSAHGWYRRSMTRAHIELHASDMASGRPRSTPTPPAINVNVRVRVVPALSAESQIHLAPSQHDEADGEKDERRPRPASVVPMTTSSIPSGVSKVWVL